jgi:hypothetical protein
MTKSKKMPLAHVDQYSQPEEDLYPYLADRLRWFIGTEPAVVSTHPCPNLGAYIWLEMSDRGGYLANHGNLRPTVCPPSFAPSGALVRSRRYIGARNGDDEGGARVFAVASAGAAA